MHGKLTNAAFNEILAELQQEYLLYAPKRFNDQGRFSDTDLIRYGEINNVEEIVWQEKSAFSPKEIVFPITQTLFHFTCDEFLESKLDEQRKSLVFLRPCDINGLQRLDTIYLENGIEPDIYYKRLRERVKFVLIECSESFENCFCVAMGTNTTENYSLAMRFASDNVFLEIKDEQFESFFETKLVEAEFKPKFVTENSQQVRVPDVDKMPAEMYDHKMWDEYSSRCIGCGRCNTTCVTCSCFDTYDLFSDDNSNIGERRRVWSCCHVDGFTDIAGGHSFRHSNGARMRFKTFHKIYDFKRRFGKEQMCVGCGRCDDNCPEYISFANCINKVTDNLQNLIGSPPKADTASNSATTLLRSKEQNILSENGTI
jgi:anaerobic sulfite reductase subunit A